MYLRFYTFFSEPIITFPCKMIFVLLQNDYPFLHGQKNVTRTKIFLDKDLFRKNKVIRQQILITPANWQSITINSLLCKLPFLFPFSEIHSISPPYLEFKTVPDCGPKIVRDEIIEVCGSCDSVTD